jgi:hypothetical protein
MYRSILRRLWCHLALYATILGASSCGGMANHDSSTLAAECAELSAYVIGESAMGENDYVEYIPGDLPLVLSVPHGGTLRPSSIPNRTTGNTGNDEGARDVLDELIAELRDLTGGAPHVILNHLSRSKVDMNRQLSEASEDPATETAWHDYHRFVHHAELLVRCVHGTGFFLDVHTNGVASTTGYNGAPHPYVELSYALTNDELNQSDSAVRQLAEISSIRGLVESSGEDFLDLIRGPTSLGGLLQAESWGVLPSPAHTRPNGLSYYSGAYTCRRHGSGDYDPGSEEDPDVGFIEVSAAQVEIPYLIALDSVDHVTFARDLASSVITYVETYLDLELRQ